MKKILYKTILLIALMFISCLFTVANTDAELVERVVAAMNDDVILLSEFRVAKRLAKEAGKELNEEEIINGMINDILLLREVKKYGFLRYNRDVTTADNKLIIKKYIDKRVKALIYIPFRDIEEYYFNNLEKYGERDFQDVKNEIEEYLLNRTFKYKLQEHIDELRKKATIMIQLDKAELSGPPEADPLQ